MGRLWRFAETIDTDVLAPGFYMKAPLDELASHCLESVRPEFASNVKAGDIMMTGENMGVGSSREQAAEVLKFLGIKAVVALSFAGIFYRNAINLGLPVFTISPATFAHPKLEDGASVRFTFDTAELVLADHGVTIELEPLPQFLRKMILDGGLVPHLEKRFLANADERER